MRQVKQNKVRSFPVTYERKLCNKKERNKGNKESKSGECLSAEPLHPSLHVSLQVYWPTARHSLTSIYMQPFIIFYCQAHGFMSKFLGANAKGLMHQLGTGKIVGKIDTHKKIPQVQKCLLMLLEHFLKCW